MPAPTSASPQHSAPRRHLAGLVRHWADQYWYEFARIPGVVGTVLAGGLVAGAAHTFTALPNVGVAGATLPVQWIPQFHTIGRSVRTGKWSECGGIMRSLGRGRLRSAMRARPMHTLGEAFRSIDWDPYNAPQTYWRNAEGKVEHRPGYTKPAKIAGGPGPHLRTYSQQFWSEHRRAPGAVVNTLLSAASFLLALGVGLPVALAGWLLPAGQIVQVVPPGRNLVRTGARYVRRRHLTVGKPVDAYNKPQTMLVPLPERAVARKAVGVWLGRRKVPPIVRFWFLDLIRGHRSAGRDSPARRVSRESRASRRTRGKPARGKQTPPTRGDDKGLG